MRKFLGYLFSPLQYITFGIFLLIFHPLQWLALKFGGYSSHKNVVDILNFFLTGTYYCAGSIPTFINKYDLPLNQSIIFVANHQSIYDIPPMIWFLRKYHAKFVSKIELTRGIPSISINLLRGGGANVDRKDPKQSISEILKLAGRMRQNNWSTIIFPEGTRSKTGEMQPFILGGVTTLIKKVPGCIVVPIAITGSWELIKYGLYPLNFGQRITYTVLAPIETAGKDPEAVAVEAESKIREAIKK